MAFARPWKRLCRARLQTEVNLPKELHARGITIPSSMRDVVNAVDISKHIFDVALSFPGETRALVERVARELERRPGPNSYFYDNNYISQLARPSLDILLQGIYSRAKLDVVFLSNDYQRKDWCGGEFRAVREIIFARENDRVMFVRTDDGSVEGVFKTDGYVDARTSSRQGSQSSSARGQAYFVADSWPTDLSDTCEGFQVECSIRYFASPETSRSRATALARRRRRRRARHARPGDD